jgi:hypothetical protein
MVENSVPSRRPWGTLPEHSDWKNANKRFWAGLRVYPKDPDKEYAGSEAIVRANSTRRRP